MPDWRVWLTRATLSGLAAGLFVTALAASRPSSWRERSLDVLLDWAGPLRAESSPSEIVFVDIDRQSLSAVEPWPWRRETLAKLVAAVGQAGATTVALDVLLERPDSRSPAALARQLGRDIGRQDLQDLAATLPDGDRSLAMALSDTQAVVGFVLDSQGTSALADAPIFVRGEIRFEGIWQENGATAAPAALTSAAAGLGAMSLSGDDDGLVRRVPLFVAVGGRLQPGLAAETMRVAAGASGFILSDRPARLQIGDREMRLPAGGMLRLAGAMGDPPVIVSAASVLNGSTAAARLQGAVAFIGGSAAELGGLRASHLGPLTPATRIQIEAARQLAAGIVPESPPMAALWEMAAAALLALLAVVLAAALSPLAGGAVLAAVGVAAVAAAVIAARFDLLLDPVPALASAVSGFSVAALWGYSETRLRAAKVRRRFEQHLAPDVVERIIANPDSVKLNGERRCLTALFTDIEGFTAMTRRIEPEVLVSLLDGYFGGVAAIIVSHGGTIDKFVGDAVHALFNAPMDLDDHPQRALSCALAILDWTERYRREAQPAAAGLGRTRIGLETGEAVVGDIGQGAKLDYTAHGEAVNTASRLEALNKQLGSSICIGPIAASHCDPSRIRRLATVDVPGVGKLEVFAPVQATP